MENETVRIKYDWIEAETDEAMLFKIDGRSVWIPKSKMSEFDLVDKEFDITQRLAEEKELV